MRTNFFFGTVRLGRAQALIFGAALIFAVVLLFGLQAVNPAHAAAPFTVNSPGDKTDKTPGDGSCFTGDFIFNVGGECTLRAAIEEANAFAGADTINFGIPGAGPHTIIPASALPPITQRVTIDGYTEALDEGFDPAKANTATSGTNAVLKIELNGNDTVPIGLFINVSNVVIKGLAINNFPGQGIFFNGGTGHKVEGNFIGTDPLGTLPRPNDNSGVIFSSTDGSTLGGTTPDKRNLISGNGSFGVFLQVGSSGNMIQGNLIGTDKNGSALGNSGGVGFSPSAGNGNRILSNSIFSNTAGLGIDLGLDGVTANDPDDPNTSKPDPDKDTGPNRLQNYPVITSATTFGSFTSIFGTLESTPSTRKKKRTFTIQFFSSPSEDPSHFGEGKTFLGETQVTTNRQGEVKSDTGTFSFVPAQKVPVNQFVTATATNKKTGDTSEFSLAKRVVDPIIGP